MARLAESPPLPQDLSPSQRARRARIVEAGLQLLRADEYERIQMRDVAVEAEVAIGTLYHYFQSKEHLFAEVLAEWATSLRDHVERAPLKGSTNTERLHEVFRRSVRAFQGWPQLVRVLMTLEASTDPFASEIFARMNGAIQDVWAEALEDLPPDVIAITVKTAGAMLDLLLRQWVMGRLAINDVYDQLDRAITVLVD